MKGGQEDIENDGPAVPKQRQRDMTTISIPLVPAAPRVGFGRFFSAMRTRYDIRRTERALAHLDDHLLRDVGLTPTYEEPKIALLRTTVAAW